MDLPILVLLFLVIGTLLTGGLALVFFRDPVKGMAETTHRPEKLPLVMIDRYIAMAVIQLGLIFFGSLEMVAVFGVAGMVMGFGDGLIYARSGHPHWKHTTSGLLAFAGVLVALYYIFQQGNAG